MLPESKLPCWAGYTLLSLFLLVLSCTANATASNFDVPLVLTGEITSAKSQHFTVPLAGDSWRYQIQWMLPEGQTAKSGQPVVIFDKTQIASQIEQLEATQLQVNAQEQSQRNDLQILLLQRQFDLKQAQLERQKAQLDADIPADYISAKNYADNQFKFYQAKIQVQKATQALFEAQERQQVSLKKLMLDKTQAKLQLARAMSDLQQLELKANIQGPLLYDINPATKEKVKVGDTVQVGWSVASIPTINALEVKAWINEVDVDKISVGEHARLRLDARLTDSIPAVITKISQQAEARLGWGQGNWFEISLNMDKTKAKLQPGMSVQVMLEGTDV